MGLLLFCAASFCHCAPFAVRRRQILYPVNTNYHIWTQMQMIERKEKVKPLYPMVDMHRFMLCMLVTISIIMHQLRIAAW